MFLRHTVWSVPSSHVTTCWKRAYLLAHLYLMDSCVYVTFPYGVLAQIWYLIVLIPDLCLLPCFVSVLFCNSLGEREDLLLCSDCLPGVLCQSVLSRSSSQYRGLACSVIVAFPQHIHLLFLCFIHMTILSCTYPASICGKDILLIASCQ